MIQHRWCENANTECSRIWLPGQGKKDENKQRKEGIHELNGNILMYEYHPILSCRVSNAIRDNAGTLRCNESVCLCRRKCLGKSPPMEKVDPLIKRVHAAVYTRHSTPATEQKHPQGKAPALARIPRDQRLQEHILYARGCEQASAEQHNLQ